MDIVYTLKECSDSPELTISLRSLENIPHDNVYIIGGCPDNIDKTKVIHIPTEQTGTKYKNTTLNLLRAIKTDDISSDFIWMNDDFFILKPIQNPKEELNLYRATIEEVAQWYHDKYMQDTAYIKGAKATAELIKSLCDIEMPLSYELHIPIIFNKKHLISMFSMPGVLDVPCLHKRSLYGNLFMTGGQQAKDCKFLVNENFRPAVVDQMKFFSTSDRGFRKAKGYLEEKFCKKSQYEL